MNKKKPIFIHAQFRTGSTYIWEKFRNNSNFYSYYEPLHQNLAHITKQNCTINNWSFTTYKMNHPDLSRNYYYEYAGLFKDKKETGVPNFQKSFSFDEFFHNDENPQLMKYIDILILNAGDKRPVMQFNRSSMRMQWFKRNYPDSFNIYLFRNPRDQWQSYCEMLKKDDKIFHIMDLLICSIHNRHKFMRGLNTILPLINMQSDIFEDERFLYETILSEYSNQEKYMMFYTLWYLSFIQSTFYADLIIDINLLSDNTDYRSFIMDTLSRNNIHNVSFDDVKISKYDRYILSESEFSNIEKNVRAVYSQLTYEYTKENTQGFERDDLRYLKQYTAIIEEYDMQKSDNLENASNNCLDDRYVSIIQLLANTLMQSSKELVHVKSKLYYRIFNYIFRLFIGKKK